MSAVKTDYELLKDVEQFLYMEAELQDECRYRDWEALWTDDAVYWVPANGANIDPEKEMSIIYDNRSRISLRVNQFYTGKRFSADPASNVRRVISNVVIKGQEGDEVTVAANVMIFESNIRMDVVWASRNEYTLRRTDEGFKMARKKVVLVNNDKALLNISFLI